MPKHSYVDFYKRLNARLRGSPFWNKVFLSVSRALDDLVEGPRSDLDNLRDPRRYHRGDIFPIEDADGKKRQGIINHIERLENGLDKLYVQLPNRSVYTIEVLNRKDRQQLIDHAIMHGINYLSDELTDDDYLRINEWVEEFWPYASDDNFVRFIGFIKNLDLHMIQLWAPETDVTVDDSYPSLEEYETWMKPVDEATPDNTGTLYWPTSHVELRYNATISQNPGGDIAHLFYLLAPIHLVLERIAADINVEVKYALKGVVDLMMVQSGYLEIRDPE